MESSLDCNDFSNMMENGFVTSSAGSLSTCRCILAGPIDLCNFRSLRWSRTWSSTMVSSSVSESLPLLSQMLWLEHFLVMKGKKLTEHFSLLHMSGNQVLCFLPEKGDIFPSLSFIINIFTETFSCCCWHPFQIKFYQGFSFPVLITVCSDNFSVLLPASTFI